MSQTLLKRPTVGPSTDADSLRQIIEGKMKDLPAMPVVVAKILQTAASPRASAHDLQALIAVDSGLTAKVLRLANSSFYGQSRRVTTLTDAVMVLGFNTVRNLTLSASMLDALAPRGAAQVFDWRAFWEHCSAVATCARMIARRQRLPGSVGEEAFVAGLLHDIGKLFLGKHCPDILAEVVLTAETYMTSMIDAEWRLMGTTHALLGQLIAEQWNFPESLAGAIGAHHDPDAWRDDPTLTYLVHAANVLTQWADIGAVDPVRMRMHPEVDTWLNMNSVNREDLFIALREEQEKTQALLGWDEGTAPEADGRSLSFVGTDAGEHDPEFVVSTRALEITSANTISEIRHILTDTAKVLLPIWGTSLFRWDDSLNRFAPGAMDNEILNRIGEQQMRESLLDRALSLQAQPSLPAVVAAPRALSALAGGHRFLLYTLRNKQKTIGFLLLGQTADAAAMDERSGEALGTLVAYAAAGILRIQSFLLSVTALSGAIDAREQGGAGHSTRVRDLAVTCGRHLGLSEARLETLELAALLHDVGKIGVPDRLLSKPDLLEPEEFEDVAAHTSVGAHLAGHSFGEVMPYILCHHERWDGSGYPAGLYEGQIPVESQILAVCEAWDAMRTGHTYQSALSSDAARHEIEQGSGAQFSPVVVTAFLQIAPTR